MSVLPTRMQNFRAKSSLDKAETRNELAGCFTLMRQDGESVDSIISQELRQKALLSVGNTLEVPVVNDQTIAILNVANATITDTALNTAMVTVPFTRYAFEFTVVPATFTNNELAWQDDFNKKFSIRLKAMIDAVETAAQTALDNAKSQVINDLGGIFTPTANVAVTDIANQGDLVGNLDPLMMANNFVGGGLRIAGNPSFKALFNNTVLNHMQFNETTEEWQWADKSMYFSNKIANGASQKGTCFAVAPGHTGIITRYEREVLMAMQSNGIRQSSRGHTFELVNLPVLNIPCGAYFYEDVIDASGEAGAATADNTRAIAEHYGFCVDIAFMTAYNSDAANNASPIIKAAVATA